MSQTIVIDKRFNGPKESANGGYIGGMMAKALGGTVAVSLRAPPPLDTSLRLERDGDDLIASLADGTLVAHAEPATLNVEVPPCPAYKDVVAAQPHYSGFAFHALPDCFVCGPHRAEGDGMRIFASPIEGRNLVAAAWTPEPELATNDIVDEEFVWAALDCPAYFAVLNALGTKGEMILTGRMAVEICAPVKAGAAHVVVGWCIKVEGRKYWAGTAVYTADGTIAARAETLWIKPRNKA